MSPASWCAPGKRSNAPIPERAVPLRSPGASDQHDREMPPVPASEPNGDDLGRIEGIEPWIADLLHKCGVGEFTALAGLSPEALATTLRERAFVELTTERIERENWLGQARRLGAAADLSTEEPDAHSAAEGMREGSGQQAAGFSLFFDAVRDEEGNEVWQTRVYHEESGQEVILPGTEAGPWASWILSRAMPEVRRRGGPPGETPSRPSLVHHLMVRILGARLAQGGGAEGFSVEVRLQVSGLPEIEQALGRAALVAVLDRDG
jgi:predicted flap endonuclease-1-like 5' DNA nuclease